MLLLAMTGCDTAWITATTVVDAPGADAQVPFGDPALAANGVRGTGCCAGGFDVYSLHLEGPRQQLTLAFDTPVFDGPGSDLVVFENPFEVSGGGVFIDPVLVEVSVDGSTFTPFPVRAPAQYSNDPSDWEGVGGVTPVVFDIDDPTTPEASDEAAGGDRFDLADLGLEEISYVRLRVDPALPVDPVSNGPDIDGVMGRSRP